jgi:hypothetical protein
MSNFHVRSSPVLQTRAPADSARIEKAWEKLLPTASFSTVTELGAGTCSVAAMLFRRTPPAHFLALESESSWHRNFQIPKNSAPGAVAVSGFDPATGLPMPDSSQELLFTNRYLEHLRMEELYMVCHEARRTVKPGGLWAIASLTPHVGSFAFLKNFRQRCAERGRPLELMHYISPEDWEVRANEKNSLAGTAIQFLLLERIPG